MSHTKAKSTQSLLKIMDGQLTIPEINQDRIFLLTAAAFFGGTKALREFLLQARPDFKRPELFKQCLDSEKDGEFLKSLFSDQKQLLFPETSNPDVHTLDITLLGKVIRACTKCGAEELRGTAFKFDQNLEDPVYCKKRIKDLNLSTEEEDLLCSALAKLDVTKDGLVVVRKLVQFLETEKSKIQLKDKILDLNQKLVNDYDFKQFFKDRKDLKVGDTKCLYLALSTCDVSKVNVNQLRKLLTALEKENVPTHRRANLNQEDSFEDFALSLSRDLPKEDYEYVRLMETCRNEMAHWGDKELPDDKYRAYFAALEVILKKLKFDVATELRPFKAGVASQEGAILEGRILANYAKQQDEIHSLKDKQIALEEQIRNLQAEHSCDNAKQQEEIKCLQLQVEVVDGKYDSLCDRLVEFATGIADVNEFTTETTKKLVEHMESSNVVVRGMKMELDVLKNRMDALEEIQGKQESRIVRLEDRADQNAADIEGVKEEVTKLKDSRSESKDRPKLSEEEWSAVKKRMQKSGLEWVERQVVTDPGGRRQRNVELEIRVDPVLVANPEEDVSRVEGKSEHEIMMMSERKIQRIVAYKDIISTETQVTFVRAVGGGGKSTLSITLYHLWCKDEIMQEFDFVILLQAREFNALDISLDSRSVVDDLLKKDPSFSKCDVTLKDLLLSEKRILFILDGLDELVVQDELVAKVLPSEWEKPTPLGKGLGSLVDAVIKNKECFILFLGRHAACMKLEKAWQARQMRTRVIEVAGFSREKIEEYVSTFSEGIQDTRTKLMSLLNSSASLMSLVSIPLYLWVFCSVYSKSKEESCPETETELLIHMLLNFLAGHARLPDKEDDLRVLNFVELLKKPELIEFLRKLSKVAYDHLSKNELIFLLEDPVLLPYASARSGLLIATKAYDGWRCQFKHKTLHELLAAVYIVNQRIRTSDVLSNTFLGPCLPMLCAFKGAQRKNSLSPKLVKEFVTKIMQKSKAFSNPDDLLKAMYSKVTATSLQLQQNFEWFQFLTCFREFSNILELDPCIPWLPCTNFVSSRHLELVCYFLRALATKGMVRNLYIDLGDCRSEQEMKEWSLVLEELHKGIAQAKSVRRLAGLAIDFSSNFILLPEGVVAIIGMFPYLETCCLIYVSSIPSNFVISRLQAYTQQSTCRQRKTLALLTDFPAKSLNDLHLRALLPLFDRLESLAIGHAELTTDVVRELAGAVCRMRHARFRLSLVGCSLNDTHLGELVRCVGNLIELDVSNGLDRLRWVAVPIHCRNTFTPAGLKQLSSALNELRLKDFELGLRYCALSDEHLRSLLPALLRFRKVDLSFNAGFTTGILKEFAEYSSRIDVKRLELSFNNCDWKDDHLKELMPMKNCLAKLNLIENYSLSRNSVAQFEDIIDLRMRPGIPSFVDIFPHWNANREQSRAFWGRLGLDWIFGLDELLPSRRTVFISVMIFFAGFLLLAS